MQAQRARFAHRLTLRVTPLALLLGLAAPALAQERPEDMLPKRPEDIEFPALSFDPPDRKAYRHELEHGVVAFLAPSKELPLIDVTFAFKGGGALEEPGQEGLAAAVGAMMRRGGTETVPAEEFDERVEVLAAELGSSAGDYQVTASLNSLSQNFQKAFLLFVEMLRSPGFQEDRLELFKAEVLEGLKQRNDRADGILRREWAALIYGREHFKGRQMTQASLDAISEEALRAFHAKVVHPGNLVIGVSGDFDEEEMLDRLNKVLASWEPGPESPDAAAPTHALKPGVYHVEKDIPQGKVAIGLRGIQRDDPDAFALSVMSSILGSSGFTSRITNRVRTEEGLAYDAHAVAIPGLYFPGEIRAGFQSKSRTVALAITLILEEFERIAAEPVSDQELQTAKNAMIESFPTAFGSKAETVQAFINDELTDRPADYWQTYRSKVGAVTKEDVQQVAKRFLKNDQLAILVIGKWEEISQGDLENRAKMDDLFGGESTELPLRDPLTLEPMK